MLNVEVLDGDGNTLESDSDEVSSEDEGDDGDSGPTAEEAQAQALAARWAATKEQMTPVVAAAASRAVVDPTKLRADWAVALERAGNDDYAGALRMAAQVAQFIKNGGGTGHATPGAADQNIAKWELAKTKIESVVEQALSRGAGDVAKIRAVWDFALAKAEASEHAAALKSLVPLSKLLAAAKAVATEGPAEIEPGTVKARQGDLAQGKALLGALKDLLADIKQAFAILPDREAAIRADIAAVQSAASGNDAAAGQVALARIKPAIDAAKALRLETIQRRDAALAALQALETDPAGINQTEIAAHGAQRLIAQKVLDVEFPALSAIDRADAAIKLLSETMAITNQRIAETARRKSAIEQALKAVSDPDGAHKAEIDALAQKRKATSDQIKDDYPTDQALEQADQALAALKALIATINARIEATKRRRAEVAALHKPLETEIARVLKLEGETAIALKLLRKLGFEEASYAKFMTAEDFDRPAAMVPRIKADVAALAAQEVEINKARKLRDDLLRENKALTPTLKAARAIFPVSPAFEADVKSFSIADYLVGAGLKNRDYASTFARSDALKVAADRLVSRKAEFEAAIQSRVQAIQKWREAVAKKPGIDSFPALLPDVKANCDAFYAALADCDKAVKAKDWANCQSQAEEALRLSAAILARRADCEAQAAAKALGALKAEHDKTRAKYDAANDAWRAISADQKAARKYKPLTAALRDLLDDLGVAEAAFDDPYFGFDYDTAVARAGCRRGGQGGDCGGDRKGHRDRQRR
jgi:hypothetical protein